MNEYSLAKVQLSIISAVNPWLFNDKNTSWYLLIY